MEMLFVTSKKSSFIRQFIAIALLFSVIAGNVSPLFASTTTDTLSKTDITKIGMNMYTTARQWEVETATGYDQEAFAKFSEKLNKMIANDLELKVAFQKICPDCDPIVSSDLDSDADFIHYIKTKPGTESATPDLGIIITRYFHSTIKEKLNGIPTSLLQKFHDRATQMADNIRTQVQEQTAAYRDVSGMWLYYDGNTDNSPYDLMDDVRRIDEIFFREVPGFGSYKNTSANDAPALITGQLGTGTWWGGENYTIDLGSEISDALSGWDDDSSSGSSSGSDSELAGDCDSGYCITIDYIKNSHYFLWSNSKGRNSFQGLFEEGLDWIIKNGDNRNFACKVSPTINTWESEFDLNILLKNVFSGASIFVFWKTPPFLKGFFDRNTSKTTTTSTSSTKTKEEQQTLDAIKTAFRRRWMDYDKPTNIKASLWQTLESVATDNASRNVAAVKAVDAINQAEKDMEQLLLASGSWQARPYVHDKGVESIKHMEKTFDETAVRTRMFYELTKSLKTIFEYILDKDECQPS